MNPFIKYLKLQLTKLKPIAILVWVLAWCFNHMLLSEEFFSDMLLDYITSSFITLNSMLVFYCTSYYQHKYHPDKKKTTLKLKQFLIPNYFITATFMYVLFAYIGPYYELKYIHDNEYITNAELYELANEWFMYYGYSLLYISITALASLFLFTEEKNREALLEMEKLKALQSESELQSLKNQINPHFLFNALSNIYSISYLGDSRAPGKIMQLSKMLRYVLYECNQDYVLLSNEIDYLKSYIDFQKLKVEHDQTIVFDYYNYNEQVKIAPMLLLPLVENAFKHSAIQRIKSSYVFMNLVSNEKGITFSIENSSPLDKKHIVKDDIGGIGIENLRKRLDILYHNRYDIQLEDNGTSFKVFLNLTNK